ncbi:hypothetical protein AB0873_16705 [Micromonospora sp. NPDC047707]|uniref:hypothetical protein n=1 Tax=Micromonospora sp. NPDC047707 TaxID=3154498 RepID=UPI00345317FE
MAAYCGECARPIVQRPRTRERLTCSTACRVARHRRRRREQAYALLARQTAAIIAGDAEALAAVEADARRIFG